MILDKENMISSKQTVTVGSDTGVVSTDAIDLGATSGDIGVGEQLYVVVDVTTTLAHGGSATSVKAELVEDNASTLATPATVLQLIGTLTPTAVAGTRLIARIQPGVSKRYLGVKYTSAGAALTAGAFSAYIVKDVDAFKAYADKIAIS